jgi:hypothetical protein
MSLPWIELALQLSKGNLSLGQTYNVTGVLQDSYTSEFIIGIEGTITTVAATPAIEGLPSLIQKVTISGPLSAPGYQPLTPINGLSGPMLSEISQFIRLNVSYSFGSLGSTGKFGVYIPCTFLHPRMPYPYNYMSVLPTNIMGSVNFNIQVATQAQADTNGTPTLAISPFSIFVQQNEYKSNSIPPLAALVPAANVNAGSFMFIPSSLNYYQNQNIQSSQQTQQLLPNNTTTLILIRSFPTTTGGVATSRQSDTVAGGPLDLSVTSQGLTLQDVTQAPRVFVDWYTLRKNNLDNITDSLVTGNGCFQFNHGLNRIFQPVPGPNQIPINYATTTTGTTSPRIDFVVQSITDSQNWLNLL